MVTRRRIKRGTAVLIIAALTFVGTLAHEGHIPLPAKGVEVDIKKGLLILSPEARNSLGVQADQVEERTLANTALGYATLVPAWRKRSFVSAKLAGRIAALYVRTGDRVDAGQLLAEIASPDLEAIFLEFRTGLNAVRLSQRQLERLGPLANAQSIPEREFYEIQTRHAQDLNTVQLAKAKLASLGISSEVLHEIEQTTGSGSAPERTLLPLHATIPGFISHTDLAIGKVVTSDEHLFEISDLSTLRVRLGVLERDARQVIVGQRVNLELTAFPGRAIPATVGASSMWIDPTSHVAEYWSEIANSRGGGFELLPGMYGTARIETSSSTPLITIPATALLGTGAERYVLVESASTKKGTEYRKQSVSISKQTIDWIQINEGALFPGDRVVTTGAHVLSTYFVLGSLRLTPEGIRNIGLKVEPVGQQAIDQVVDFDGQIDLPPENQAVISAPLAGIVQALHVEPGQSVKRGDLLVEVGNLVFQQTQIELVRDQLDAKLLEATSKRLNAATRFDSQVITQRRIWEIDSQLRGAINRRDSARRSLLAIGLVDREIDAITDSRTSLVAIPVRSPIDGIVVRIDRALGESVNQEQSLLEIHDLTKPWVKGMLSEIEGTEVPEGTTVRIRFPGNLDLIAEGKVIRSDRIVDESTRTVNVWISMDQTPATVLPKNLLVRISAILSQGEARVAVPNSAIAREGTRAYVFTQAGDGLISRKRVDLGRSDDRNTEIRGGVSLGEVVAIQGVAELQTTYATIR